MKTYSISALVLVVTTICISAIPTTAQDTELENAQSIFDGKFVTIYTNEKRERSGCIIQDVEFKEIGGRLMLVGTGVDTGVVGNWTVGVQIGVAWDTVTMYYAMTPEQYKAKKERHAK